MQVKANLVNAFTERSNGGNHTGVIFDADNLTDNQMMDVFLCSAHTEHHLLYHRVTVKHNASICGRYEVNHHDNLSTVQHSQLILTQ